MLKYAPKYATDSTRACVGAGPCLAEEVAGRQGHVGEGGRVPCGQHVAPVVRLGLDARDELLQLVHALAAVVRVHVGVLCAKVTPLEAVHWTQIPLLSARHHRTPGGSVCQRPSDITLAKILFTTKRLQPYTRGRMLWGSSLTAILSSLRI